MTTLVDRIERAAERTGSVTFITGDKAEAVAWARIHDDARAMAARLQGLGVGKGSHIALLGPTSRPLVTAIQATWLAGATVVVLPLPMRLGSIDEFVGQTRARVRSADVAALVVDADLAAFIESAPGDPSTVLLHELAGNSGAKGYERPRIAP